MSTYTKHFVPFYLQLYTPAFPGCYSSPEDDWLIELRGATNDIYSSSQYPKENTDKVYWPTHRPERIHSSGWFAMTTQKSQGQSSLFSTAHTINPIAFQEQLSPSLTVFASLVVLLRIRCELALALKISNIHPRTTMLSATKIKSAFCIDNSGCMRTDTKALT